MQEAREARQRAEELLDACKRDAAASADSAAATLLQVSGSPARGGWELAVPNSSPLLLLYLLFLLLLVFRRLGKHTNAAGE